MKRAELNAIFTAKVAGYLNEGYTINTGTMSGSQGEIAHVDVSNGKEIVRIVMDESIDAGFNRVVTILIGRNTDRVLPLSDKETIWNNRLETIEKIEFFKVSENWFVGTSDTERIHELRNKRYITNRTEYKRQITPSANLIRTIKRHKGFSKANVNNVVVERFAHGYRIKLLNRDGVTVREYSAMFKG